MILVLILLFFNGYLIFSFSKSDFASTLHFAPVSSWKHTFWLPIFRYSMNESESLLFIFNVPTYSSSKSISLSVSISLICLFLLKLILAQHMTAKWFGLLHLLQTFPMAGHFCLFVHLPPHL